MHSMQGSYIGNTTASQAVKAGSIPVPCSKNSHFRTNVRVFVSKICKRASQGFVALDAVVVWQPG